MYQGTLTLRRAQIIFHSMMGLKLSLRVKRPCNHPRNYPRTKESHLKLKF